MMRHIILISGIITLISMIVPPASALPLYITMTGKISSFSDADGDMTHGMGDEVTSVFMVDTDLDGYRITGTGMTTFVDQNTSSRQCNYYFADYIEGDGLMADDNSQYNLSIYAGYDSVSGNTRIQRLYGNTSKTNSSATYISVSRYSNSGYTGFDSFNFEIGDEFLLVSYDGLNTSYQSKVFITGLSEEYPTTAPVPEPATMFLFGLALVALAGYKKILKQ